MARSPGVRNKAGTSVMVPSACRPEEGRVMVKQRPTQRQVEVLRVYIRAGSVAAAAHELGIGETTVRQHLSGLYRRTGCVNAAQAAYWLGAGEQDRGPVSAHR
jgi:DNA-binding NarL/FixJ family response regulator